MHQHGPCGCDHDQEEKKEEHECCGGGHCHDEKETKDDGCCCGHDHGHSHELSPEDMEKLKATLKEAGYEFEETAEGELRILEK